MRSFWIFLFVELAGPNPTDCLGALGYERFLVGSSTLQDSIEWLYFLLLFLLSLLYSIYVNLVRLGRIDTLSTS